MAIAIKAGICAPGARLSSARGRSRPAANDVSRLPERLVGETSAVPKRFDGRFGKSLRAVVSRRLRQPSFLVGDRCRARLEALAAGLELGLVAPFADGRVEDGPKLVLRFVVDD